MIHAEGEKPCSGSGAPPCHGGGSTRRRSSAAPSWLSFSRVCGRSGGRQEPASCRTSCCSSCMKRLWAPIHATSNRGVEYLFGKGRVLDSKFDPRWRYSDQIQDQDSCSLSVLELVPPFFLFLFKFRWASS